MPKTKRRSATAKSARTKSASRKTPTRSPHQKQTRTPQYSAEYREYLERYAFMADDRPRLSPTEFDKLDDEILDLLALDQLDDEQAVRKQELEYLLLLDSEP